MGQGYVNDVMPGSDGWGFWDLKNNSELRFGLRRGKLIFGARRGETSWGLGDAHALVESVSWELTMYEQSA